jgi:lipopolysaccharide exporter
VRAAPRRYSVTGSVLITVAMRWTDRVIGLVSTLVLARLLVPEDFGIVAMASLAIALADVVLDIGVNVALIRRRNATPDHYDTAWTLRIVQTSIATAALILLAPLAAAYFRDARVELVLQVLAFSLLLSGWENIWIIELQKNMQFGAEFRFMFLRRLAGFVATIIAAWLLRSYWALVVGALAGRTAGVVLSYLLHPGRPKFSLKEFTDLFSVSQWLLVRSVGGYLHANLHKILVGRWATTPTMGAYALADQIAEMATTEVLAPLNRVLFPAFADNQENLQGLKRIYLLAQSVQTLFAIPAAVGLALVADEAVRFFLGDVWVVAVPFVQVLALISVTQAITTSGSYVMIVLGRIRSSVLVVWVQVIFFAAVALALFRGGEALHIAWLRLLVGIASIPLLFWLLMRALPILGAGEVLRSCIRPLMGAAAMAAVLSYGLPAGHFPLAMALAMKIALGVLSYLAVVAALWWLAGRPEGAESYVLDKASTMLAQRRAGNERR